VSEEPVTFGRKRGSNALGCLTYGLAIVSVLPIFAGVTGGGLFALVAGLAGLQGDAFSTAILVGSGLAWVVGAGFLVLDWLKRASQEVRVHADRLELAQRFSPVALEWSELESIQLWPERDLGDGKVPPHLVLRDAVGRTITLSGNEWPVAEILAPIRERAFPVLARRLAAAVKDGRPLELRPPARWAALFRLAGALLTVVFLAIVVLGLVEVGKGDTQAVKGILKGLPLVFVGIALYRTGRSLRRGLVVTSQGVAASDRPHEEVPLAATGALRPAGDQLLVLETEQGPLEVAAASENALLLPLVLPLIRSVRS
jgi:hypothetical protein